MLHKVAENDYDVTGAKNGCGVYVGRVVEALSVLRESLHIEQPFVHI